MGLVFNSFEAYEAALDKAIDKAMSGYVADRAVEVVQRVINETVYQAYTPEFFDRTGELMDKANLPTVYPYKAKHTLAIIPEADWNYRGFRYVDGLGAYDRLPEAIAYKHIYHAPPRDFYEASETELNGTALDSALTAALVSSGF